MNLKKQWIYIVLAVVVFAILLGLATAFDYQISSTIADLEKGEFFSNNVFGKFIEVIGSFPIYYMIALALFAIGYNYQRLGKRAWQLVLFFVCIGGALLAIYIGVDDCMDDFADHSVAYLNWAEGFKFLLCFGIAVIIYTPTFYFFNKLTPSTQRKLLIWAIVVLGMVVISQIFIYILKPLAGRLRYRGISLLGAEYNFVPWYDFNGSVDKEAVLLANPELLSLGEELALDLIRDSFRSFPSGHTASSAAVYGFLYLPFCLDKFNNKKSKILLNVLTVVFTGLVAFGRIIVGAHYFSDVLFGGTITYASLWLSVLIFEKLRIKILEKEPMLINE